MRTVAFLVAMLVLLFGVVVGLRAAVFYFSDPPSIEVTRLSSRHIGTPVVVDSERSRNPGAALDTFLGPPSHFVVESYVRPGKNYRDQLWVNIVCVNERDATQFQDTFSGGEPDGRGGLSISLDVKASDAGWCSINAIAGPHSFIGDPSDTRRGFARLALYCLSECEVVEPETRS